MQHSICEEVIAELPEHRNDVTEYIAKTRRAPAYGRLTRHELPPKKLAPAQLSKMRRSGIFRKLNFTSGQVSRSGDAITLRVLATPSMNWVIFVKP